MPQLWRFLARLRRGCSGGGLAAVLHTGRFQQVAPTPRPRALLRFRPGSAALGILAATADTRAAAAALRLKRPCVTAAIPTVEWWWSTKEFAKAPVAAGLPANAT